MEREFLCFHGHLSSLHVSHGLPCSFSLGNSSAKKDRGKAKFIIKKINTIDDTRPDISFFSHLSMLTGCIIDHTKIKKTASTIQFYL